MDRRDMLDLLQLDRRTDRVLPNGYCLLPPARSCDKGNACHGCDHFATDRSHLPEIRRQLAETEQLIEQRKAQHLARYGEPMSERNIWLEQRLTEIRSMRLEIAALQAQPDDTAIIRGAGVCGRPGYQDSPAPVTITSKPGPVMNTTGTPPTARASAGPARCAAPPRPSARPPRPAPKPRSASSSRNKQEINFRSVARAGGVSLDFLYASADLRQPHRDRCAPSRPPRPSPPCPAETADPANDIVHVLTTKLREERAARRAAVSDLEQQLAAAHGELLRLRRVLQQHGVQRLTVHVTDASATSLPAETGQLIKINAR